jgi:DNA-binding response OmpR family regulator
VDEIIQQSLAGKRFGLMGFEMAERDSIIATLGTAGGIGHVIGAESNIPGLNSLSRFDACFINASAAGAGGQSSPIEMIANSRKPAIVVGTYHELVQHIAAFADLNRDCVLRPYAPQDLLLRAYRVLRFVEKDIEAIQASIGTNRVAVVADDDDTSIRLLSMILKNAHFDSEIVRNGARAVAKTREKQPDLVLLDISMPEMNGFEALTELRNDPKTKDIPVILVSAHRDEQEVVKGFSLGADDYVIKPFNSGELVARINRVLREPEV